MYRALTSFTTKDYDIRYKQILQDDFTTEDEITEFLNVGYIEVYDGTYEITENGTYDIKDYEIVDVNVGGGGIDFSYAKLEDVSTTKNGIIGKVTEIDLSNITFTHCTELFSNATNLTTILNLNTEGSTSFNSTFSECSSLETLPNINTSNSSNFSYICSKCTSLKNVPVFDMVKCGAYSDSNMFQNCSSLTNESLNNILASLLTAKNIVSTQRTLAKIGLSETQATTCTTLSNWQSLVDKGWTTGY